MAFDRNPGIRITSQPLRLRLQGSLVGSIDVEAVGIEEDAIAHRTNRLEEIFLTSRDDRIARWCDRVTGVAIGGVVSNRRYVFDLLLAACGQGGAGCQQ